MKGTSQGPGSARRPSRTGPDPGRAPGGSCRSWWKEPGELFPRTFRLLTSLSADQVTGEELLAMYRQRGKAEGHMGELMSVVNPALSSSPRPKRHYRGRPVENPGPGIDALRLQRDAPASRRLRLPDHARPARRPRTRDRHRVEPEAAARAGAARPGPLHRLRPPDRHDRECSVAALASPGPPAPAPARTRGVAFRDRRGSERQRRRRGIRVPGTGIRWPYRRTEARKPCRTASWRPSLGSGDPLRTMGEPHRPESSPAVVLGE